MKALVVYDSFFGNTEKIALAVGVALDPQVEVTTLRVGELKPEDMAGLDVLIVGSPTRAFSPTPAVKKWLKDLKPNSLRGIKVAAFDTRMDVKEVNSRILTGFAQVFGYAAEPMGKQLVKKGGAQAVPPEGFIVEGSEGPLRSGELERAAAWARRIVTS